MKRVCVLGLGYIGLPTASLLASQGYDVLGVDINSNTVRRVNLGEVHIFEPDLEDLVNNVVKAGRLKASVETAKADVFIIAVPTPFKDDFVPDISHVEAAMMSILPYLEPGNLVILESTSPVGTTQRLVDLTRQARPELFGVNPVSFAYGPERVLPGQILRELRENDRVVGGINSPSSEKAAKFYRTLTKGEVFETTAATAEMTKLTENAYRDVNIAFANELSLIADKLGVDVWELIRLANRHPRVNILQPGPGVGGHCIAVDPWFLVHAAPGESQLIRRAREVNLRKEEFVLEKILAGLKKAGEGASLAYLGLTYKPDIDDIRESPPVHILERLLSQSSSNDIYVVEPNLAEPPKVLMGHPRVKFVDLATALSRASVVALLVDHSEFRKVPPEIIGGKQLIDTRGVWSQSSLPKEPERQTSSAANL